MGEDTGRQFIQDMLRRELIDTGNWAPHLNPSPHEYISRSRFYIETLEEFVDVQEQEEVSDLVSWNADLTWHYPVHWDEIFRENLRVTFLASACAYVEHTLWELCSSATFVNESRRWEKPRRSILAAGRHQLASVGFSEPTPHVWGDLQALYSVRNSLLHNSGYIAYSSQKERRAIQDLLRRNVGISGNGHLELKEGFPDHVLSVLTAFFEPMDRQFRQLCERSA